jgi:WD40 repeat protein
MTLALYDVPSGKKFFEKKNFITIYPWSFLWLLQEFAPELVDILSVELTRKAFSPDGRYLLVASDNDSLAFDLSTRTPMKLPDSIKTLLRNRFGFLGSDRLVGVMGRSGEDSRLVRFPSGELVAKLDLGFASVTGATHGDYLILRPVDKYPAGVYDIAARKIPRANRQSALDVYDDYVLSERTDGEIGLYSFSTDRVYGQAKLPPSPFGGLRTVATSPDFKWLAASNRSRGGVWNVASGGRIMHVRGFLGAWFGESAAVYADFPPFLTEQHSIVRLDLAKGDAAPLHRLGDVYARQLGSILLTMRHADPAEEAKEREQREKHRREAAQERERFEAEKRKKQSREAAPREERPPDPEADVPDMPLLPPRRNVRVEVSDARSGEVLWSRHFPKELPGSFVTESEERLVLLWRVTADQVKEFARENAELQRRLSNWKDKEGDYYLEILEARSGKKLGFLLVETGQSSFRITDVFSAGDWVAVLDSQNRIQLFALSTGDRRAVFFGDRIALSAAARRACIENEPGKLALYDLDTSAEPVQRGFYVFSNPVSFFQFSRDGRRLFVLTSNQMIYLLDVESASAASAAPAHPQRLP